MKLLIHYQLYGVHTQSQALKVCNNITKNEFWHVADYFNLVAKINGKKYKVVLKSKDFF